MLRRDLLSAEIEKLSQVLARIVGLKQEGKILEAEASLFETLENNFGLKTELLKNPNVDLFKNWLNEANFNAETLNLLSDFLYSEVDFENQKEKSILYGHKLTIIYETLRNKHKMVHLINMGRQSLISQYLG